MTTSVHHWRFETGEPQKVGLSVVYTDGMMESSPRGWYCWVYAEDDVAFADWMAENCPSSACIHRFNSGNPMWTVYITDEREATLFTLRWL
jgi:hypothetical protein